MLFTLAKNVSITDGSTITYSVIPTFFNGLLLQIDNSSSGNLSACYLTVKIGKFVPCLRIPVDAFQLINGIKSHSYVAANNATEMFVHVDFGCWNIKLSEEVYIELQNSSGQTLVVDITSIIDEPKQLNKTCYNVRSDTSFSFADVRNVYAYLPTGNIDESNYDVSVHSSLGTHIINVMAAYTYAVTTGLSGNQKRIAPVYSGLVSDITVNSTYAYTFIVEWIEDDEPGEENLHVQKIDKIVSNMTSSNLKKASKEE